MDIRNNPSTRFPIDLETDMIIVNIDERSTSYTVGESAVENLYVTQGTIRAFRGRKYGKQEDTPRNTNN